MADTIDDDDERIDGEDEPFVQDDPATVVVSLLNALLPYTAVPVHPEGAERRLHMATFDAHVAVCEAVKRLCKTIIPETHDDASPIE